MQARSKSHAQGIDISHHNGAVDWVKVAADGISFAFLKASEGQTYRDNTFAGHIKAARAAGLLVGAYHFVTATSESAAIAEAGNFAGAIAAAGGVELLDLPPVMDYENNPAGISRAQINAVAEAFLTTLERITGRRPMIYTGNSFASNFGSNLGAYKLWIAKYSESPPTDAPAWSKWAFWQYSDGQHGGVRNDSSRKVNGVPGYVDLNEYAGTVEELKREFGLLPSGEEDEDMQLSNYQWGVLETNVKKLIDGGKITDATWLDKIKNRTLTTSELSWLTFVVSLR